MSGAEAVHLNLAATDAHGLDMPARYKRFAEHFHALGRSEWWGTYPHRTLGSLRSDLSAFVAESRRTG